MAWLTARRGRGFWRGLPRRVSTWLLVAAILMQVPVQIPSSTDPGSAWGLVILSNYALALCIVAVTIEALLGLLPRLWLLLPLCTLVPYFGFGVAQRIDLALKNQQWANENSRSFVVFDASTQMVVLEPEARSIFSPDGAATAMAHLWAYTFPGPYFVNGGDGLYDKLELPRDGVCDAGAELMNDRGPYCLTKDVAVSAVDALILDETQERLPWWGGTLQVHRTSFLQNGKLAGTFVSGEAVVYPLVPVFMFACSIRSLACEGGWQEDYFALDGWAGRPDIGVIGAVLNLTPRQDAASAGQS